MKLTRKVGYYISPNSHLHNAYSITKRGAMRKAEEFMKYQKVSKVEISRVDDDVLMFTYSKTKKGLVNLVKA